MPLRSTLVALLAAATLLAPSLAAHTVTNRQRGDANRLLDAALADSSAYDRLARLTDTFGPRLSGSKSLEDALDWILAQMKSDGLANVRGEPAMVPHWGRGGE